MNCSARTSRSVHLLLAMVAGLSSSLVACGDDDGGGDGAPDAGGGGGAQSSAGSGGAAGNPGATGTGGDAAAGGVDAARFVQQAYLKASDVGVGDEFGYSVALSGDTLVVGAPFEDGDGGDEQDASAEDAGAVYVFTRNAGAWSQQAYLKASNAGAGDQFGKSVALLDDMLVVGAPHEESHTTGIDGDQTDNTSGGSGAVYVFTRSAGVWSQEAYIKASNTRVNALFGGSVALFGDTLAVGSPFEASDATGIDGEQDNRELPRAGAVYVFRRTDGMWSQEAYVKASNTGEHDEFGGCVALHEDTLAVGASNESSNATFIDGDAQDDSAENSGAVYVFTRSGETWSQQAYVKAVNTAAGDRFGFTLALDEGTLAVGAPFEESATREPEGGDEPFTAAGAVYVYRRTSGVWAHEAYLKAREIARTSQFGRGAIALHGDTLAVGAQYERTVVAPGAGAVHVFTREGGTYRQQVRLQASNPTTSAWFGHTLAMSEDTIAVGSPREQGGASGVDGDQTDTTAMHAGAVYVFE